MQKKLLSKSKFARLAGVNPSTVTRLSETVLKAAVIGKQIDAAHPDAVAYLENREREQTPPPATGLDPLYENAVLACQEANRYSITFIQRELGVGFNRAKNIFQTMAAAGVVPGEEERPAMPEPPKPVATKPRGAAVVKEAKKKQEPAPIDSDTIEIPEDIQAFADMTLRELIDKFGTDVRFVDWLNATQKIEAINEKRLKNAQTKGELVSRHLVKVGVLDHVEAAHIRMLTDGARTIARRAVTMVESGRTVDEVEKYVAEHLSSHIKPVKTKIIRTMKSVESK